MPTVIEVKATLTYALRHPDCTPTSHEDLMKMAAKHIEELEEANHHLGEALERNQKIGLSLADKLDKSMAVDDALVRDILDKAVMPDLITDLTQPYDKGRYWERIRIRNTICDIVRDRAEAADAALKQAASI